MSQVADLKVKIFADGADYEGIVKMSKNPVIKGFTTNPTLMRKAGVSDTRPSRAKFWPRSRTGRCRSKSLPTTSRAWPSRRVRSRHGGRT